MAIFYKMKWRIFFKTEFWRKFIVQQYDDENIWNENLLRTSLMGLLELLDIVEDQIN